MRVSVCRVQSRSKCLKCGHPGVPVELSPLSSTKMHQVSKKKLVVLGCFGSPGDVTATAGSENKGHTLGLCYVNVVKDTRRENEANR